MDAKRVHFRFDDVAIGNPFIHVYSHTLIRFYEKKSLSSAYDLDPVTLERTGVTKVFGRCQAVLPLATVNL